MPRAHNAHAGDRPLPCSSKRFRPLPSVLTPACPRRGPLCIPPPAPRKPSPAPAPAPISSPGAPPRLGGATKENPVKDTTYHLLPPRKINRPRPHNSLPSCTRRRSRHRRATPPPAFSPGSTICPRRTWALQSLAFSRVSRDRGREAGAAADRRPPTTTRSREDPHRSHFGVSRFWSRDCEATPASHGGGARVPRRWENSFPTAEERTRPPPPIPAEVRRGEIGAFSSRKRRPSRRPGEKNPPDGGNNAALCCWCRRDTIFLRENFPQEFPDLPLDNYTECLCPARTKR